MPYGPLSDPSAAPTATPSRVVPASRRSRSAARPSGARRRLLSALRHAAPALLAYAAVRALGVLVLAVWAHREHRGLWHLLAESWDCDWYLKIAANGYADTLGHAFDTNNLAFFPLFPLLIRAGDALLPAPRGGVGLAIAVGCSFLAAWGIFKIGERLHGRRAGVLLVVLWACLPVSLVQWMGYTESLFTALAAWSLYAVLTGRWVWAGALAALAGLTRPTGVAVAAAVSITALLALRRRFEPRVLAGALLAPLGWLAYVGWVGARLGRWDGYFAVQKLWHNEWDGGIGTLRWMKQLFLVERPQLFLVIVTIVLFSALVLFAMSLAGGGQPLPLLVYAGLLVAIVLGSSGVYFPRARFLLPAFPLLLPLALALARMRTRVTVAVLTGAALTSAAFGGHMLLVWLGPP
ncbi:glycosyltransferase family 39 protein [Streptomyces lasiicapitis]|uniref:glycosyltransferase family 39 protein n=1 Tax=Streptomyces lasiicapitis TaxID=1923961 RepID=UPI0036567210